MIPLHHLLHNRTRLYNACVTHTTEKNLSPQGDYELPDNLEKNCAPNFSPSLDTNRQKEDSPPYQLCLLK